MASPATDLPTRRIGDGDDALDVSVVGLGCNNFGWRLGLDGTRTVLAAAREAGVTLLDTADVYGGEIGSSEALIGEAIEGHRDEFVLATKFGMEMRGDRVPDLPRGSSEYIRWAVDGSLRRLRTDRIDLYQYHIPDGVTPIAETLGALDELVVAGKVRWVGCSNFNAAQLAEAEAVASASGGARFVSLQNEYSLLERSIEVEVQPVCARFGVAILPYFPLASGLLSGKYRRDVEPPAGARLRGREVVGTDAHFDAIEALDEFARARGLGVIDVAIAALAAQPMVASVIAGATRPEQVAANVAAVRWQPSADDLAELDRIVPGPRR